MRPEVSFSAFTTTMVRGMRAQYAKLAGRVVPVCCAVMFLGGGLGRAQPRRQRSRSIFETQYSCLAKGPEGSLQPGDLTVMEFTIGASTIRDVQKRFPGAQPVRLAYEEEAERGICIKNPQGMAVVFATSVMGAPDTLVAIYLAPARLAEGPNVACQTVGLPAAAFSSQTGIRVGMRAAALSDSLRARVPANGGFCAAYEITSSRGPLQISKSEGNESVNFTGAEGRSSAGKLEWVKLFGIASD